jgi:NAD(P)-dependent dehydrogenase (short-subunit alcohol dehydrogenase family)
MESLQKHFGLSGKGAVVTGAARGIGRAIAETLVDCGAAVVIVDRDAEGAASVATAIRANGGTAHSLQMDVADESSITEGIAAAAKLLGSVDILVNNAAMIGMMSIEQQTMAFWDRMQAVNVRGVFLCTRAAASLMQAQGGGGRIINISSFAALHPSMDGAASYCASKGAVNAMTRAIAYDLAPHEITVNAIMPHAISHPGAIMQFEEHGIPFPGGPSLDSSRYRLSHVGVPADIAGMAAFLAGPSACYITGQAFLLDGGFSIS